MLLSELIKHAQELHEKHGDLTVVDRDFMPLKVFKVTDLVRKKGIKRLVYMSFFRNGIDLKDI
jgi:hypothetical protein